MGESEVKSIKKFLEKVYSFDACKKHIQTGRLDKALLLFVTSICCGNELWDMYNIYSSALSETIEGAISIINSIIGTNFTCQLKGSNFDKYYITVASEASGNRLNMVARYGGEGYFVYDLFPADEMDMLLVFDTEKEAQDFLYASEVLEEKYFKNPKLPAYKDAKIEKLPKYEDLNADMIPFAVRSDPFEIVLVKTPIYDENWELIDDANIILGSFNFSSPKASEITTKLLLAQYQL